MSPTLRALTTNVHVDIDDALPERELAAAVLALYARTDEPAALAYELTPAGFRRDGRLHAAEVPADVVPMFELDLYEQVVARAAPGWVLHAAALDVGGEALVLAGPSGAGKTTMALALLARGHRLITEEVVWLSGDGEVRGLCRALHVRDDVNLPAGWRAVEYSVRPSSRVTSEKLVVVPPASALAHDPLPVRAFVWLTHGPDREGGLERLTPRDALARFWDSTLRPDDAGLAAATALLRTKTSYRLASTSFADAMRGVEHVLAGRSS